MENMRAKEFLDDYAVDDLNVFGRHEEHYSLDDLMEEYAKIYHESEVEKLRLSAVSGQSEQLKAFVDWWHNLSQEELAWYEGRYVEVFESL